MLGKTENGRKGPCSDGGKILIPGGPFFNQQVLVSHGGAGAAGAEGSGGWEGALQLLGESAWGEDGLEGSRPELLHWSRPWMTCLWKILECSLTGLYRSTKPQFLLMALSQRDKVNHIE